jgi:PAS domain-containing protein
VDRSTAGSEESQLRESEATFRILAQTTTAAIFIHRDGHIFFVNGAAETITGYDRAELRFTLAVDGARDGI